MSGDRGIDYYFNILGDYTLRNGIRLDSVPKKILEEIPEGSNVIFKGGKLKRTVFEGINFNRNLTIEFSDCEIDRELQFQVENCVFIFRDMKRSNVDFHIEVISKTVSSRLSIDNSRFETIILNNSKLVEFTISNTICRNLVVNESFINFFSCKDLNLRIIDTQSIFRVKLSKILNLEINEVKNLNKIKFESLESEKVELFNSNIESIEFVDYNVCSLNITNGSIDDIQITVEEFKEEKQDEEGNITSPKVIRKEFSLIGLMPTYLGKIHIKDNANNYFFAINLSGDKIILRNINTFYLTINGDIKEKSRISNCEIENLELNNFEAVNGVKFNNVNNSILAGCFMMRDSSLTNVALNPSFLHTFNEIKFINSSLLNLEANNLTEIPTRTINPFKRDDETNYLTLYRELKKLAQEYGDNYLYNKFKALEYNERLNSKEDIGSINRIILWCNKFSNNHSTKPQYAFVGIVAISLFFSVPIIISLYFNGVKLSANQIWSSLTYFVNPLKLLNEYSIPFHGIIYLLEVFYKLALGYLIYQMIAAFRKFNK